LQFGPYSSYVGVVPPTHSLCLFATAGQPWGGQYLTLCAAVSVDPQSATYKRRAASSTSNGMSRVCPDRHWHDPIESMCHAPRCVLINELSLRATLSTRIFRKTLRNRRCATKSEGARTFHGVGARVGCANYTVKWSIT
jgi:hypothetical protein